MASTLSAQPIDTQHEDMIHDAQLDYYGKRMATASSDRTIKIFEVSADNNALLATLRGHDGPVWQVAWSHPKFGTLLASCGYDSKIFIWKEEQPNNWIKVFEDGSHESSVNAVAWAPHSYGLCLAAGSADGNVSIFTYRGDSKNWERQTIRAHPGGVTAVSWGPDLKSAALLALNQLDGKSTPSTSTTAPATLTATQAASSATATAAVVSESKGSGVGVWRAWRRLVTGGCDNRIRIWRYSEADGRWSEQAKAFANDDNRHKDWVRDVAWAPSVGLPNSTIASCSDDKSLVIWTESPSGLWTRARTIPFTHRVWKLSWSLMGNILAVAQGDNRVSLWKEQLNGEWANLSQLQEEKDEKKKILRRTGNSN